MKEQRRCDEETHYPTLRVCASKERFMKFGPVPVANAGGKILGHNIAGADGRRALKKGKPLSAADIERLRELGRQVVYVAELESDDVGENAAAKRIAVAALGSETSSNLRLSGPAAGRVNFLSNVLGVLRVDAERLTRLNEIPGLTAATLKSHSPVRTRQIVATVKIIPYAVPEQSVQAAESICAAAGTLIRLDGLHDQNVALILSGSASIRERVLNDFDAPLCERLETMGATIQSVEFIPLEDESGEVALAEAMQRQISAGAGLIILAGETAIMDQHDIAPRAVARAGGTVICVGAPVDPGNLLMLAELNAVPILGAPGCARSRKTNIVDWILPRLLAGDRLTQTDITAMGHGGLLEDVPERPMPRSRIRNS